MNIPYKLESQLNQIDSVATLPHIATEILEVMRNKSASMRKIAGVIEKDPSITVKILKIANSPLWGAVGRVESVQRALILLGLKQVSNIVIAISLYSTFARLKPNPHFDRQKFWQHSIGTAQTARKLSGALEINFQGEEFVAGLIHDLGKIVLDQFMSETFKQINEEICEHPDNPLEIEQKHLGCTHAEIGAALLQRWNFPTPITMALQFHHYPEKAPDHRDMVAIIHLADIICRYLEDGAENKTAPDLTENMAWQILVQQYSHIGGVQMEKFIEQLSSEIDLEKVVDNFLNN